MNYDMSSYFEDPEFKEALAKYEGMVENHTPAYFEAGPPEISQPSLIAGSPP